MVQRNWPWDFAQRATAETQAQQASHKILEADIFINVITDRKFLARGIDRARRIEPRGINSQVDIGHEKAEHDQAVAALHILPYCVTAHCPFINPNVKRVLFADD